MPDIAGGYDEWAAAGKPNSGAVNPGNAAFQAIVAKSGKKSKTTGKSPQDTAVASLIKKVTGDITKHGIAAAKTQTAISNKAVADANKASNTTPDEASKQQDKQWAALVTGLKVAWEKGTLPKGYDTLTPPEVGTTNLKENPPADTAASVTPPTGSLTPEVSNALQSEYQRTGQMPPVTTDKVQKLQAQLDESKRKVAAAQALGGGSKSFNPLSPGDWIDKAAGAGKALLTAANTDLEYVGRPGSALEGFLGDMGNPDRSMSDVWHNIDQAFQGKQHRDFGNLADELSTNVSPQDPTNPTKFQEIDPKTGQLVPIKGINPLIKAPVAFAGGTLLDPTTYVSLGTAAEAAQGFAAGSAARDAVDVNNTIIKTALKAGAAKGTTASAERIGKNVTKNLAKGGPIGGKVIPHQDLADKLYKQAIAQGLDAPAATAAVRLQVEKQVAADAAKQKMATITDRAFQDNRKIMTLKLAGGKEIPLGKVPMVDLPYRGAQALKAKALKTDTGQGIAKMFSTKYWFPGETHTLWDKANSMGVASFVKTHDAIQDAFRGLSGADRRRIADATDKGVDLAGEFGTRGKDLGPAQKFAKELTAQQMDEKIKVLGKYGESDRVDNFVYHHYRSGNPEKIRATKKARSELYHDGAVGEDRFSLQQADDMGLKPVREMDKILLAQTADHQRQMVRSAFDRRLVDTYGHVTDNPVMADALGLIEAKAPKLMKMAPGQKLYMHPDVKKVYDNVSKFMGKSDEDTQAFLRKFDKVMRGWKIGSTTLRPAHHIRNAIGDTFQNFLDGVDNPHRYVQGAKMTTGHRANLRIKAGNMVLTGDDIKHLSDVSGMNKGFISSEFMEGRNPVLNKIQGFAQGREETGRYAHFIDRLIKEGNKAKLGANNKAGMYQIATKAAKDVNKWNINYGDLTPFERNVMKRVAPFYTWTRKSMPLMMEAAFTRPGRVIGGTTRLNNMISTLAGVDPADTQGVPYPPWLKESGYARISDGAEPNVLSLPMPFQDYSRFVGDGSLDQLAKSSVGMANPLLQWVIERATGKNTFTGGSLDPNMGNYLSEKLGVVQNIKDLIDPSKDEANKIGTLTGIGSRKITENTQLGELRRQQDPVQAQMSQINKDLGDYEVHKLKNGYSVYNKHFKITEKSDFSTPEDALIYAIGLSNKAKGK